MKSQQFTSHNCLQKIRYQYSVVDIKSRLADAMYLALLACGDFNTGRQTRSRIGSTEARSKCKERGKEQEEKREEEIAEVGEIEDQWERRWNSERIRRRKKGSEVKNPPANAGDPGLIPGQGKSHPPRSS